MCYNIHMENEINKKFSYRKWPLFLPVFLIFFALYFFIVYSFDEITYRSIAETTIMAIFVNTAPLLCFFYLKVVKIDRYKKLGLDLLCAWLISSAVIYLIMLTYITGLEWFGAIALLFFLFCYYLFWQLVSFLLFKIIMKINE